MVGGLKAPAEPPDHCGARNVVERFLGRAEKKLMTPVSHSVWTVGRDYLP
jgi:hypothetical protein